MSWSLLARASPKTGSLSGSNAAVRYGGAVRLASGPANLPDARLGVHACCVLQNEKTAEAFNAAAAADSSCAMAFWGQAMSLLHPLWTPPSSTSLEDHRLDRVGQRADLHRRSADNE